MWLTSDMNMYVTIVKDTVAATLPKMAVSVLLDRIVTNQLLRRMQKMALTVRTWHACVCRAAVERCECM
jgi:hypothetical protein